MNTTNYWGDYRFDFTTKLLVLAALCLQARVAFSAYMS